MSDTPFHRWRPHPWHGLDAGPRPPRVLTAYIEMTPLDTTKYELDKATGYLRVDRPQRSSALPPTLYGFVPRTYCADAVAALAPDDASRGDGDPLDICVLSERPITRSDILLTAHVVGGLQMIDGGEADDKLVAVLHDDPVWAGVDELADLPPSFVERLTHYFSTYKLLPGASADTRIARVYGRAHAELVVRAAMDDYAAAFGG